jgi:hypothetical protein
LREGLLRYLDEHIQPGSFLTCVLQNDLRGAMERADAGSRAGLYDVVFFLYNHAPVGAWGDKKAVERWCTPAIPLLSPPTLGEELGHAEDGTVMCPGCGGRHPLHGVVWDCCLPPAYGGLGNTKTKHTVLYVWCGRTRLIPLAIDGKELP